MATVNMVRRVRIETISEACVIVIFGTVLLTQIAAAQEEVVFSAQRFVFRRDRLYY
ncbi:MAG: hypothetical protein ACYSYV_07390 [Planctomycetota bacterium]|jgi:hypothetical protein